MSFFDRLRTAAPVEPAAVERIQGPRCAACYTPDVPMVPLRVMDSDEHVCANPAVCRQRAQLLGIYCVYPRSAA